MTADVEPDQPFTGRVAVITGAGQGLGEATARLIDQRGAAGLLLTGRDEQRGRAVADSLGCEARFVPADLADLDAPARIIEAADETFGRIDVLVNAAALTGRGSVWDTGPELWERMLSINTRAPGLLISGAAHLMKRDRIEGSIVNIGSVAAHGGADFLYPYSASKMALQAITRNAAYTLLRHRIRVNLLQPGWMATPGEDAIQKRFHEADDDWLIDAASQQPFGRLIDPAELARAICFLASSESGLMTGSIIDYDQSVHGGGDAPKPPPRPLWAEPT